MHFKNFNNFLMILQTLWFLKISSLPGDKSSPDKVYKFIKKIQQLRKRNDDSVEQSKQEKNLFIVIKFISCYEEIVKIYFKDDIEKEEFKDCTDAIKQVSSLLFNLYNNETKFRLYDFKETYNNLLGSMRKLDDKNAIKTVLLEFENGIINLIVDKEIRTEIEFKEVIFEMEKTNEKMQEFFQISNDFKSLIEHFNESIDEYKLLYKFYDESVKKKNLIKCNLLYYTESYLSSKIRTLYDLYYGKLIAKEESQNFNNMAHDIVSFVITVTMCEGYIKLLKKYKKKFALFSLLRIFTYEEKYLSILSEKFYNFLENWKDEPKIHENIAKILHNKPINILKNELINIHKKINSNEIHEYGYAYSKAHWVKNFSEGIKKCYSIFQKNIEKAEFLKQILEQDNRTIENSLTKSKEIIEQLREEWDVMYFFEEKIESDKFKYQNDYEDCLDCLKRSRELMVDSAENCFDNEINSYESRLKSYKEIMDELVKDYIPYDSVHLERKKAYILQETKKMSLIKMEINDLYAKVQINDKKPQGNLIDDNYFDPGKPQKDSDEISKNKEIFNFINIIKAKFDEVKIIYDNIKDELNEHISQIKKNKNIDLEDLHSKINGSSLCISALQRKLFSISSLTNRDELENLHTEVGREFNKLNDLRNELMASIAKAEEDNDLSSTVNVQSDIPQKMFKFKGDFIIIILTIFIVLIIVGIVIMIRKN